jgi:lycopene cyclase CruA
MIAPAPATHTPQQRAGESHAPDLNHFRQRYPETVASFGTLARREEWLRRIWRTESRWREALETNGHAGAEVIVRGAPPAGRMVEGEFDLVYAGGTLGLLHAAVMACRYGQRVLVFDEGEVGRAERGWNVSDEELKEFARAELLSVEEIESAVVNRYGAGFVKFHDAASRVKADPLWVSGVMDVAVEPDKWLQLAAAKIRAHGAAGCALLDGLRFVRAYVEPHRVTVETQDARGARRLFAGRLFVDAGRGDSAVARQIRGGRAVTHVCPTVGTLARGYVSGAGPDKVDFRAGELLVSTEDAADHRQLIWEGFPGAAARGEYTACLFFQDAANSPADKSLLSLFERYFETLPSYKRRGAQWRVERPVFGYAPSTRRQNWRGRGAAADDRVMLLGEAAGLSNAWAFSGEGERLRQLHRQTHLMSLALAADMLDADSLAEISDGGPRGARVAALAELMRPTPKGAPAAVNETLNAVMAALHGLDERIRRQLLQDRLTPGALKSLLARTVKLYPRILARMRERLGARGTLCWIADLAEELWSEKRGRHGARVGAEERAADPAREFARHVARYKNGQGAED